MPANHTTSSFPSSSTPGAVNPFARALAEARSGGPSHNDQLENSSGLDPNLSKLMNQSGGQYDPFEQKPTDIFDQQQQLEKARKAEQLKSRRLELHRQINPVDARDVFNARERQVREELEKTRYELQALAQEIAAFNKEIDIVTFQAVVNPGQEGTGTRTFFQKLREWIQLLRQQIHAAQTWATQIKSKKKRKQGLLSLDQNVKGYEETAAVWNSFRDENVFGSQGAG